MDKRTFLKQLQKGISSLPREDVVERLNFYSEMIDDYVEEGLSEEEAVERIGSVNEIISAISPADSKRQHPWKIAAIALGSPIWISLLISVLAIFVSVYASVWSVIISLWCAFGALAISSFAGILSGIALTVSGYNTTGIAMVGAALVCGGLSVFVFYGSMATTKGALWLTKKITRTIRNHARKKEDVYNA